MKAGGDMLRGKSLLPLLALVGLLLAACAGGQATSGPVAAPAVGGGSAGSDVSKGAAPASNVSGTTPAQGIPSLANLGRDLILTANVSMRSDDPWATADRARGIATGLGGDLLALSQTGSGDQRNAVLTMRVPSNRFDEAIAQLKKLDGEVISSSVGANDATDQLVDLQARLSAVQGVEARYLQLVASAKTVDEMLRVESALSQVRTQIEQLQAQLKSMKDRVAYSTITLSVTSVPTIPPVGKGPTWDPSQTFARAITALGTLVRGVADVAIWALVLGWIPLVAFAFALLATRVRARRPAA